jgi:hypothetical protein
VTCLLASAERVKVVTTVANLWISKHIIVDAEAGLPSSAELQAGQKDNV